MSEVPLYVPTTTAPRRRSERLVFYCRTTSASTAPCTSRRMLNSLSRRPAQDPPPCLRRTAKPRTCVGAGFRVQGSAYSPCTDYKDRCIHAFPGRQGNSLSRRLAPDAPRPCCLRTPQARTCVHMETLIIYKLSSRKFTTQNDRY